MMASQKVEVSKIMHNENGHLYKCWAISVSVLCSVQTTLQEAISHTTYRSEGGVIFYQVPLKTNHNISFVAISHF